jgi:hypothetical protein
MVLAVLLTSPLLPGLAWAGEQKWAETGTVAAVTIESRAVVVEIPRGKDSLTVGAEVLSDTVLKANGRSITLADIRVGDRVRIEWSRREHGLVAHTIVVMKQAPR